MTLSLLLTLALLGPAGSTGQDAKITTCEQACEKVTDLTAGRWPKSRKGTEEAKTAFEEMRQQVHAQCMTDCDARGKKFIRCVRVARNAKKMSVCYQKAGQ
jgi:hypothetical protein